MAAPSRRCNEPPSSDHRNLDEARPPDPHLTARLVLLAVGASLAVADHRASGRLAKGISVGGVPVGGLTEAEAVAKLERTIGSAAQRPVRVVAAHERFKLGARRAGVAVDLAGTVHAAYEQGRTGSWPARAWRSLRGGKVRHDQPVEIAVDRRKVDAFVRADRARRGARPGRRQGRHDRREGRGREGGARPPARQGATTWRSGSRPRSRRRPSSAGSAGASGRSRRR